MIPNLPGGRADNHKFRDTDTKREYDREWKREDAKWKKLKKLLNE
jgi:hypothetical protein